MQTEHNGIPFPFYACFLCDTLITMKVERMFLLSLHCSLMVVVNVIPAVIDVPVETLRCDQQCPALN
jgi:hypothetical protein